jgi:hypothetical protein
LEHIRGMTNRRPAFVLSKLNDDLVRGSILGLLVFLGLIALLSLFYFGI